MGLQVEVHHLGEEVREDEDLARPLVGVREVAEHLAHELAVHLALGVAHLLVADRDAGVAEAALQLLDDGEDGLAARGAGVLDRLDRLGAEAGHLGHEAGEQALLVERDVAGGADRGRRRARRLDPDLLARPA